VLEGRARVKRGVRISLKKEVERRVAASVDDIVLVVILVLEENEKGRERLLPRR
jgi:hypothetical protein